VRRKNWLYFVLSILWAEEELHMKRISALLLCLISYTATVVAADLEREKRLATELANSQFVGEGVTLTAGSDEIFAIHTEVERGDPRGGAILLHGRGAYPDTPVVIGPLRRYLPKHGWESISVQMPLASTSGGSSGYEKLIPEAAARISAAVEHLKQRKIEKIVLIGHSLGARMAAHYLVAENPPKEIIAWVAIGIMLEPEGSESKTSEYLSKIKLPTLDIYGSRDLGVVHNSAQQRKAAARKAENSGYRQTVVTGADHSFVGLEGALASRVGAWMAKIEKQGPTTEPEEEEEKDEKEKKQQ
jgi:dienelactone hydrolase